MSNASPRPSATGADPGMVARIGVGIDIYDEARDAAALGAAIASATRAELMLVAVQPEPVVVLPSGMDWTSVHQQLESLLAEIRDGLTPYARTVVETDISVARALERVVRREHRDLLIVGSSRHGPEGRVRIGKRTRQLLCHFECALAVAPRGMHRKAALQLARVGIGYDGGPESRAALALAGAIAIAAGAQLHVRGVVDDRIPGIGLAPIGGRLAAGWNELGDEEEKSLRAELAEAAAATDAKVQIDVLRGRPADALLELSRDVDLLVVGSRRWGPVARLLLGSTGEALLHDASCPVVVVPRPRD